MDVWGKVLGLLNKPLNCTSLSLYLFPRELGYATYVYIYISIATSYVVGNSLSHSLELFYFVLLSGDFVMKVPKQVS